ncbi:hypothetical protein ACRRTK_015522 [Alexandromys fortis]
MREFPQSCRVNEILYVEGRGNRKTAHKALLPLLVEKFSKTCIEGPSHQQTPQIPHIYCTRENSGDLPTLKKSRLSSKYLTPALLHVATGWFTLRFTCSGVCSDYRGHPKEAFTLMKHGGNALPSERNLFVVVVVVVAQVLTTLGSVHLWSPGKVRNPPEVWSSGGGGGGSGSSSYRDYEPGASPASPVSL